MAPVNANIIIDIQTAKAQAELKALQAQVTSLNAAMVSTNSAKGFDFGRGIGEPSGDFAG